MPPPEPEPADQGSEPVVRFESVAERHFSLLRGWLDQPHWREWWGETEEELSLIREGMETGTADGFIAFLDAQPVGYIQSWRPTDFDEPWAQDLEPSTLGVDMGLGEAANRGRGLGPYVLQTFCRKLFAEGATRLVIDPNAANLRAVRAYAKAGFKPFDLWLGETETTLLMTLARPAGEIRASGA